MQKNDFDYKYSAPNQYERNEIETIKHKYEKKEKNGIDKLKELDKKVESLPRNISITSGTLGALLLGLGLSFILEFDILVFGIIFSIIGVILISLAYPLYAIIFKKNKEKYKDEILALADELLNKK